MVEYAKFLLGLAAGTFGTLLAVGLIPPPAPPPCQHRRERDELLRENWTLRDRVGDLLARCLELEERLAAQRGPFELPGKAVDDDAARRAATAVPKLGDAPEDRIPPQQIPIPGGGK